MQCSEVEKPRMATNMMHRCSEVGRATQQKETHTLCGRLDDSRMKTHTLCGRLDEVVWKPTRFVVDSMIVVRKPTRFVVGSIVAVSKPTRGGRQIGRNNEWEHVYRFLQEYAQLFRLFVQHHWFDLELHITLLRNIGVRLSPIMQHKHKTPTV